jgi:hypothetical protein
MITQEQLINDYLNNETQLYQAFYQQVIQSGGETALQPIATFPSKEEIKAIIQQWWQQLKEPLRKPFCEIPLTNGLTVCSHWQLIKECPHEWREFIIAITVDLTLAPIIHLPHTLVAVTVIVTGRFLDEICP